MSFSEQPGWGVKFGKGWGQNSARVGGQNSARVGGKIRQGLDPPTLAEFLDPPPFPGGLGSMCCKLAPWPNPLMVCESASPQLSWHPGPCIVPLSTQIGVNPTNSPLLSCNIDHRGESLSVIKTMPVLCGEMVGVIPICVEK